MAPTFLAAEGDDDGNRRTVYRDQRNVVAGATYYRLTELDRRYRAAESDDPLEQARHAAVRDELLRRGYHVNHARCSSARTSASTPTAGPTTAGSSGPTSSMRLLSRYDGIDDDLSGNTDETAGTQAPVGALSSS